MEIILQVPESAIEDVKEYCRLTRTDLQGRMQGELDIFVGNAICFLEQRREIEKKIKASQDIFKEKLNGD